MTVRCANASRRRRRAVAALSAGAVAAAAGAVQAQGRMAGGDMAGAMGLPIDCTPGKTCWITVYGDNDPGPGARDHTCGALTVDGHHGLDFAIRDTAAMQAGVPVLAAAAGTVQTAADGMRDVNVRAIGLDAVKDRPCGNEVRIDHGGGWTTQYCHLRAQSIAVKPGETVRAGQPIAKVGLSGVTEYPHLYFTVSFGNQPVDPFRGLASTPQCGPTAGALWRRDVLSALPSGRGALYDAGFSDTAPTPDGAQSGAYRAATLPRTAPALFAWGHVFNVAPGDVMSLRMTGPDGATLVDNRYTVERQQVRLLRFAGKRQPPGGWPTGTYRTEVEFDPAGTPPPTRMESSVVVR